jgi:hypothetical protein
MHSHSVIANQGSHARVELKFLIGITFAGYFTALF